MSFACALRTSFALSFALAATGIHAQAAVQADVQALADRWAQAYNGHSRTELGRLYTEDAHLMMHGAATIVGRADIEEFWAGDFKADDPLTLLVVTHAVHGTDMTLVHGDYQVVSRKDGGELGGGRFAHIWTRAANGDWRLDRDMWNQPFDPYGSIAGTSDAVQSLADQWTHAYNEHDRNELANLYTEGARLMMHGAPTIAGRAAVGSFWAQDFEEDNPLTLLTVTHAVQGLDMVLVHGNYQVIDRDDGARVGFGRFAHIWTRADGEWRLDRDLWQKRSEPAL
jgi:uncharacterized protein (TIGR02246 family)